MDFARQQEKAPCTIPTVHGKSVRCMGYDCKNNVPYNFLRKGDAYCRRCHITCSNCTATVHPDDAGRGLYKGLCIDCTRCEQCNVPMWDYVCECEVR